MALVRHVVFPVVMASAITARAYRKKQLTPAGCVAAWIVGFVAAASSAWDLCALLAFFFSSTFITKFGAKLKGKIDTEYHASGNRSAWQVACNGGAATALLLLWLWGGGRLLGANEAESAVRVRIAILAHYCATQGDTWSSEIGVLSRAAPRLIIGLRTVPPGTNGGVSPLGFAAAVLGGALLSLLVYFSTFFDDVGIPAGTVFGVGVFAAFVGSAFDSVLGQLLQLSVQLPGGKIVSEWPSGRQAAGARHISGVALLSNNAVNFIVAAVVMAGAFFAAPLLI